MAHSVRIATKMFSSFLPTKKLKRFQNAISPEKFDVQNSSFTVKSPERSNLILHGWPWGEPSNDCGKARILQQMNMASGIFHNSSRENVSTLHGGLKIDESLETVILPWQVRSSGIFLHFYLVNIPPVITIRIATKQIGVLKSAPLFQDCIK